MGDCGREERIRFIDKPINFRPILFCALSFAVGIFFFSFFAKEKLRAALYAAATLLVVFLIALPFCIKSRKKIYFVTSAVCLVFCLSGFLFGDAALKNYVESKVERGDYLVVGEVDRVSGYNGKYFYTLRNCTYNGECGGNLNIRYCNRKFEKYDKIRLSCSVVDKSEYDGNGISPDVMYDNPMITTRIVYIEKIGESSSLKAGFLRFTDEILSNMGKDEAAVGKALICGDTSDMGEKIDVFRLSAIAHVFAVSGMHVGLVFAAFSLLLKFIPLKKYVKSILIGAVLFFYAYLCGMTASSVRAATMCFFMALTGSFGEKKDRVNSLALAIIVVLALNPFDLFTKGFILSFAVSFGLIVLINPLNVLFSFTVKKLRDSLAVLVSAEAVSIPLSVMLFGYFPIVSVVTNLFLVPLVSLVFFMLWFCLLLCMIMPVNRLIALYIPNLLLKFLTSCSEILSKFPLQITNFPFAAVILYFAAILIVSDIVNVDKVVKRISGAFAFSIIIIAVIFSFAA